ncbi:MAG: hypothetical protein HY646_11375, partial [Acidobacteria bacterium]|nr:hypothetical protein [Acidobacteriota bacterium]
MRFFRAVLLLGCIPVSAFAERWDIGLTQTGIRIEATAVAGPSVASPTVLLIGGLAGNDESARAAAQEVQAFESIRQDRRQFRLLAIPLANPDRSKLQFPPSGVAYRENPESHALWRWIAAQAPDLVLIAGSDDSGLSGALSTTAVAGVGRIPARRVDMKAGSLLTVPREIPSSEARREIERRLRRSPRQLAAELAQVYGHDFDQLTYI